LSKIVFLFKLSPYQEMNNLLIVWTKFLMLSASQSLAAWSGFSTVDLIRMTHVPETGAINRLHFPLPVSGT